MLRDRLVAACSGDEEQADMVLALLRREQGVRETWARVPALLPAEQCERCTHPVDDDGFCPSCGWMTAFERVED